MYLIGNLPDEIDRLSGRMSKNVTAIRLPAAKAKKYGRAFLNLIAKVPPIIVEQNVVNAKATRIQFISLQLFSLLINNSMPQEFSGALSLIFFQLKIRSFDEK
jgi:hypothetical protein